MGKYSSLHEAFEMLRKANAVIALNKPLFRELLTDKEVPLDTRWEFWCNAPEHLKGHKGWISAGRLKAFKVIGIDDPTEYEGLFYWDRYQSMTYEEYLDASLEILAECDEGQYEGVDVCGEGCDSLEDWIEQNPVVQEFIRQFKEEVLASDYSGFRYDW